jgi:hypothetical protein
MPDRLESTARLAYACSKPRGVRLVLERARLSDSDIGLWLFVL